MRLNQIITQARERLGLTPQELGEAIGISRDCAWDLESHEDELSWTLSLAEFNRLCQILHLTPHELLERAPPKRYVKPTELRSSILQDCHRRTWTVEQFSDEVGWDVQGLIDNPTEYLSQLNLDGLQDICWHLGINPLAAIPLPVEAQQNRALDAGSLEGIHKMTTISVDEIQQDLAGYLTRVQAGETLLITQAGHPVAEINPIKPIEPVVTQTLRPIGLAEGQFVVPDDFDDPLPDEIQRLFEGR